MILGPKKSWVTKNLGSQKNFWSQNFFWSNRHFWLKKNLGPQKIWVQNFFGKHLCVTNRFLGCSLIVDFGGVLLVVLVLLVTWIIWTPNPQNTTKSPWVVYVSNFILLALPLLIDFGGGSCSSCSGRLFFFAFLKKYAALYNWKYIKSSNLLKFQGHFI